MQTAPLLDGHWPALLARLSGVLDLDASARATGALRQRRNVADGATLLRLALAHGPGGLSLRSAVAVRARPCRHADVKRVLDSPKTRFPQ